MNKIKKYNIGLDIGTESVGWAVTDPTTNKILKRNKKRLWGVRLFDEASSAETRRTFRCNRRRLARRKQRILYLQEIFKDEINKTDPTFFMRLKDGFLHKEDKTINKEIEDRTKQFKYNLFIDKNFNDSDYYVKYPTIYHLRYELMHKPTNDIRLIYLAMHHIIKYRGNFLQEGKKIDVTNIDIKSKLESIFKDIEENYDDISTYKYELDYQELESILINSKLRRQEKQKLINKELDNFIKDTKASKAISKLMTGIKTNLLDIFSCEAEDKDQESKCEIKFDSTEYEDKLNDLEEILDKNIELINSFKELYDEIYLSNIFKSCKKPTLSYLMIEKYNKHKQDKKLLKEYLKENDKKKFFSKYNTYHKYTQTPKYCDYDTLIKELKKILSNYENSKIKEKILFDINNNNFLPKITDTSNGIYPYQINLKELNKIIETQSINYPFLSEKLEDGTYKIAKLLTFRIPYYVGPLNRNPNQKDSKAWIVKNNQEKITPFNFNKVVNKIESANEFITRMTSNCTYLYDEKAIPANSLLYSKFKVLNELKQIKIDDKRIDKELEKQLIKDMFLKYPKVTDKTFRKYLIDIKYPNAININTITGYSSEFGFANNLKPYIDFINIFDIDYVLNNEEIIENLISWITIFEDKKILKEKIKIEYPYFEESIINKICNLKYKGWSALSKKLLTEIYYTDKITKERFNIIELMEETQENFMQIIFNKKYNFQEKINKENFTEDLIEITIEDIQELTTSPANKRAIWQSIQIIKELVSIIGNNPEHIYIEMSRGKEESKRTSSRNKQLLNLYEKCKQDIDEYNRLYKELKDNEKLDSEKYFLYYLQQGKSLYSATPISLTDLNDCEIDHIIPRSLIKDNSLDNKALVLRQENQDKGANNVLPDKFKTSETISFWKQLRKNKFISNKKYNNLIRQEFREKDIEGFINKQLVETRQITKHVAALLNNLYDKNKNVGSEDTVVQFINANISHNYREKYELYKYRQLNNYHHAHDAYLAATLGNYKTLLFKHNNIKEFIANYKNNIKTNEEKCYGIIIDNIENNIYDKNNELVFDANDFKDIVCNNLYNQDILVTRKTEIYTGEFYNQTIYPSTKNREKREIREKANISIKTNLDPDKYGGYTSIKNSYMILIKYTKKDKVIRKLIGIPIMYTINKDRKNLINDHIIKEIGTEDYKILKNKIPYNSLIKYKEQLCTIVGTNEVTNAVEFKFKKEIIEKYNYLLNYIFNDKHPINKDISKEENKNYWNNIFNLEINDLFNIILEVIKKDYPLFKSEYEKLILIKTSGEFYDLVLFDKDNLCKKEVILQLFRMLKSDSGNANLEKLNKTCKFNSRVGRKNGQNINQGIIYNTSITGIKETNYNIEEIDNEL